MNKPAAALATVALVGGLISLAPTSAQAASCDDPAHPIADTGLSPYVAVGTTKIKTMKLEMTTYDGCQVTGASVTVRAPRHSRTVSLHEVGRANGFVFWEGSTKIAPKSLRNSDAGTWALTYQAKGADAEKVTGQAYVLRASRLSFNAGPEPVKDGKLSYAGKLERASWNKHHYYGYRQQVSLFDDDGASDDGPDLLAQPTTTKKGTFRVTQNYRGPGDYFADFTGTGTTAASHSQVDHVSTPR